MFRDEWLEEAPPPPETTAALEAGGRYAWVRSAEEIKASLDRANERNGVMLMPEMFRHTGRRFRIRRKVEQVLDGACYVPASEPVYLLEGLHCAGSVIDEDGPCDRGCRLLWHQDWLRLE